MNQHQQSPRRKKGSALMVTGGIMLLVDLLTWSSLYVLPSLGVWGTGLASLAIMFVFLFGLPFIFLGVMIFLIGLAITLIPVQSAGSTLLLIGLIMLLIGILAFIIPQYLVAPGSGDTLMAWMAGLTVLFVGIPLPFTGAILLLIGLILVLKRYISSSTHRQVRPSP